MEWNGGNFVASLVGCDCGRIGEEWHKITTFMNQIIADLMGNQVLCLVLL